MAKSLIKNLVVGFGFMNGLWFSLGIDPKNEVLKFLQPLLSNIHPWIKILFIILPTIFTITTVITVLKIYHKGGLIGAGAVVLAFLSGALMLSQWIIACVLLLVAAIIGSISIKE